MPWEKTFDLDEATDKAAAVFWSKGYEATSIADLVAAMGVHKGSLYNAFGDKRSLFLRALERYNAAGRRVWMAELEATKSPTAAILAFFDRIVEQSAGDCDAKGCFIVNTALEMPHQTPEVKVMITDSLSEIEGFFHRMIERGQSSGSIPDDRDPIAVSKALLAMMMGMRVLSRTGVDEAALSAIRDQAMTLIAPSPK